MTVGLFKECECGKRILFLHKMCTKCFFESHDPYPFKAETYYDALPAEVGGYGVNVGGKLMFVLNREADAQQARSVYDSLFTTMSKGTTSHIHVWSAPLQRSPLRD